MNIEKILAQIPKTSADERRTMRGHALSKLETADLKWVEAAAVVLAALDGYEADQKQAADAERKAQIEALLNAPAVDRIQAAFEFDSLRESERRLIQVLLDHPGGTCAELSAGIGWAPNTWDMGFGSICAQRYGFFASAKSNERGKGHNIPLLADQIRGENGEIRYTMKPEAVEAFGRLGFRVKL
jgi:hypothetical protein